MILQLRVLLHSLLHLIGGVLLSELKATPAWRMIDVPFELKIWIVAIDKDA